jgi:hypoxanthine-guanine phosphoribosyltransferase
MNRPAPTSATGAAGPVPPRWRREVARVLITERQIARRIRQLSRDIERDFKGRELVVVSLLTGTVVFLADLIRHLALPFRLDFIGVLHSHCLQS